MRFRNLPGAFARNIARSRGKAIVPADHDADVDAYLAETGLLDTCKPFTMTSPRRLAALGQAVDYVIDRGIPGDFVECGVWKGGSLIAMRHRLTQRGDEDRVVYGFDTFAGMTPPTNEDQTDGESAASMMDREKDDDGTWLAVSRDDVAANVRTVDPELARVRLVEGPVEQTLPGEAPEQIAILRLDTDWYESTKHELETLYPRLSVGGVLIIDDYGYWRGSRQAVDEFIEAGNVPLHLVRIDQWAKMAVKVGA
ncbi:MAG: TylF/MycF/NovP-related O-methyltransferase [Planctomycetota bacterium]